MLKIPINELKFQGSEAESFIQKNSRNNSNYWIIRSILKWLRRLVIIRRWISLRKICLKLVNSLVIEEIWPWGKIKSLYDQIGRNNIIEA